MKLDSKIREKAPIRIGAVSYLNTKPLIATLGRHLDSGSELRLDLPSRLATQLASGELDFGLIPAIEFFRGPELLPDTNPNPDPYRIVSNACIACRGIVRSVRLFFRVPPNQVRSIAIDEGSRTSVALALILLHQRFGVRPTLVPLPIEADPNSATSDAVLVIGDRAMRPERYDSFTENWDLGLEWYRETGLPFVFAMWVGRQSKSGPALAEQLEQARDEGVHMIERLSQQHAPKYALSIAECIEYLSVNLRFTMHEDEIQGLMTFYRMAAELNLTSNSAQPVWPIISPLPAQQLIASSL